MVKIRMTRFGRHKSPFYRIVVTDSRVKRDGGYIKLLGNFDPSNNNLIINKDETIKYLLNGAQPTDTVLSFLKKEKIWASYIEAKKSSKKQAPKKTAKKPTAKVSKTVKKEIKK